MKGFRILNKACISMHQTLSDGTTPRAQSRPDLWALPLAQGTIGDINLQLLLCHVRRYPGRGAGVERAFLQSGVHDGLRNRFLHGDADLGSTNGRGCR